MTAPSLSPTLVAHGARCPDTAKLCRDKDEMTAWLIEYRRTKRRDQPQLRMYECQICRWWHVAKRSRRRRRAAA